MTELRPSTPADYPRLAPVLNAIFPLQRTSVDELHHADARWDHTSFFRQRLLAFDDGGELVGFGTISHLLEQFHPDRYGLRLGVAPHFRQRGHGSAIYAALTEIARGRGAMALRASARESDAASNRFARRRGFVEAKREWQSRLFVDQFDAAAFAGAAERVAGHGIAITTLAAETRPREHIWREIYALDSSAALDIPEIDPFTPMPYEVFISHYLDGPHIIPEAYFLARDGERYVGLCRLFRNAEEPDILEQEFTAVDRAYRGRGIAMALKLKTVEYARAHGKREIRTWNATTNQAMLRINEAMGFVKEPAEIVYIKDLPDESGPTERRAEPAHG